MEKSLGQETTLESGIWVLTESICSAPTLSITRHRDPEPLVPGVPSRRISFVPDTVLARQCGLLPPAPVAQWDHLFPREHH